MKPIPLSFLPTHLQKGISLPPIHIDDVHIWQMRLDLPEEHINIFTEILSADELDRANRFYFEKDRSRFISARGMLRIILSQYLGLDPKKLLFEYSNYGKPEFRSESGFQSLKFNLSHSEGIALLAVTRYKNIGIDVERIRDDIALDPIANLFYSNEEISSLERIGEKRKKEWFYTLWTRKEAFLKATGKGLSYPLKECDVSFRYGGKFSSVTINKEKSDWMVKDLFPILGFAAALAVEGNNPKLSCTHFDFFSTSKP
ncbi:4'-phosphopantetheinyl transferase superfamily protein [Algoriphagus sp. AK58]|uniref:4'-phosphopantetheinyl transferase family protein n=1 Tax=Algoriphagus sp. AK58 TaxID=1406877 RepID=UPI00164FE9B1|nr:4'-phosphopantetheinyl transferase superfamily protein [Algoriphagus sp. AK58]MBC6366460.1 4'-phosphopantetheinyl transferase [Algoriphagus sp. AK58]